MPITRVALVAGRAATTRVCTPTPAGLSPSLTWHASPPSRTRPPRMVSFRQQGSGEIGDGAASPTDTSAV